MTIVTDNVRVSTLKGMAHAMTGSEAGPKMNYVLDSDADEILTGMTGSDVVYDAVNHEFYMVEAQGGSEWIHLISGS